MRKTFFAGWLALLLGLMMLPLGALAEESTVWTYSFSGGDLLTGEKMDGIREFLDAVQLEAGTEIRDEQVMARIDLISYGKSVFALQAGSFGGDERFGLYCSLLGERTLLCRKDQLQDFLLTMVQAVSEYSFSKGQDMTAAENLARRAGGYILNALDNQNTESFVTGFDLNQQLSRISGRLATDSESETLDPANSECPGAVLKQTWHLSEEDLNLLIEDEFERLGRIPMLGSALARGELKVGNVSVSEASLREQFDSVRGDTILEVYTDSEGDILRMSLLAPGLSASVTDPRFSGFRGIDFLVERNRSDGDAREESTTTLKLIGVEGTLLTIRTEKKPGPGIAPLPANETHEVGEMSASDLRELLSQLSLTIAGNTLNLIMDLPRIVFDTLVGYIF